MNWRRRLLTRVTDKSLKQLESNRLKGQFLLTMLFKLTMDAIKQSGPNPDEYGQPDAITEYADRFI